METVFKHLFIIHTFWCLNEMRSFICELIHVWNAFWNIRDCLTSFWVFNEIYQLLWKEITLEPEFLSESPRPDDYRFAHLLYNGDCNMFLENYIV